MSDDSVAKSAAETKVEYRRLGSSGLKVSVPILGAMSFGDPRWMPWVLDEEKGLPLLKAAYDRGLNTWDTANIYSNGASELIIGKALKKYDIPRRKVVILTKCFATLGEEPHIRNDPKMQKSKDYVNQGGLSRGAIFRAVHDSLKRLDTDYIDLLQIHRFDANTPVEETMKALHDLVLSGKVNYIGASSMFAYQFATMQFCAEKNGWTKFVSMQNHYSLVYREEEREMNRYCTETGVGLIPWAPLARGILARPPQSGDTERAKTEAAGPQQVGHRDSDTEIVKRVQELAEKKGWPMSIVVLAWIDQYITSPIIGFSSVERIDEACQITGKSITKEESDYLEELYVPQKIAGHQ